MVPGESVTSSRAVICCGLIPPPLWDIDRLAYWTEGGRVRDWKRAGRVLTE